MSQYWDSYSSFMSKGLDSSVIGNHWGQWVDSLKANMSVWAPPNLCHTNSTDIHRAGSRDKTKSAVPFQTFRIWMAQREANLGRRCTTSNDWQDQTPPWWVMWRTVEMLSDLTITCLPLSKGKKRLSGWKTAQSSRTFMWSACWTHDHYTVVIWPSAIGRLPFKIQLKILKYILFSARSQTDTTRGTVANLPKTVDNSPGSRSSLDNCPD